jgi:hypothetical protein
MCVKTDVSIYTAGFMILKKKRMTLSWPYQFLKLNSLTGDTETGKLSRSELSRLLSLKQVPAVDQTAYPLQTSVASLATDWWMEPWPPAWFLEIYIELHVTGSLHTHTHFSVYLSIFWSIYSSFSCQWIFVEPSFVQNAGVLGVRPQGPHKCQCNHYGGYFWGPAKWHFDILCNRWMYTC